MLTQSEYCVKDMEINVFKLNNIVEKLDMILSVLPKYAIWCKKNAKGCLTNNITKTIFYGVRLKKYISCVRKEREISNEIKESYGYHISSRFNCW